MLRQFRFGEQPCFRYLTARQWLQGARLDEKSVEVPRVGWILLALARRWAGGYLRGRSVTARLHALGALGAARI